MCTSVLNMKKERSELLIYPKLLLLLLLLLLHGSTVLVGPWPPSRPSSSRVFCVHLSSSLWHPSSSGPPSRRPSTLTLVFLHSYFLLECSDITSLPPFPHSSSPHVPAISNFLFLFLLLCPILHIIASLLHLFCFSSISYAVKKFNCWKSYQVFLFLLEIGVAAE